MLEADILLHVIVMNKNSLVKLCSYLLMRNGVFNNIELSAKGPKELNDLESIVRLYRLYYKKNKRNGVLL